MYPLFARISHLWKSLGRGVGGSGACMICSLCTRCKGIKLSLAKAGKEFLHRLGRPLGYLIFSLMALMRDPI